ncbi:MAG TPA: endonuclease [Flavobacterium sp.]|nr:endonuclease [Flavobacterium sp.]
MKKTATLLLLLFVSIAFAQIPPGYYTTATGTGYTLKTQLYNIIKGHNDRGYAGLYTTYTTSDKDFFYENDGTLLDIYSENPTGPDAYEFTYGVNQDDGTLGTIEGQRYNREHLMPQSVFASATPMYSDAHFIYPTDKHVNGQRGDLPFGKVNAANWTSTNGSKRGTNLNAGYSAGYAGVVFEPIDEFKGDVARSLLYFATRYENVVSGYSYVMLNGTANQVFSAPFLNILLTWNAIDPVSAKEIARNNAIYTRQGNRNPFIDMNSYVTSIWGAPLATTAFEDAISFSIYPNPAIDHKINIESENAIEDIQLITINGQIMQEIKNPVLQNHTYTLENLPQGFYFVKLTANNQSTTKKIIVN